MISKLKIVISSYQAWGFTGVNMLVFWIVTLVGRHQHFRGKYFLHLQPWRLRQYAPSKRFYLSTSPYALQSTVHASTSNLFFDCIDLCPFSLWSLIRLSGSDMREAGVTYCTARFLTNMTRYYRVFIKYYSCWTLRWNISSNATNVLCMMCESV